ncbi:hypothetical protein [Actinoallomurus sp. NPDC052274]|uniref:hypothetical protein n=1 Tax=Actinoallomurus sp. NPDC052274 TaxID=3155420 RepID=UPI0034283C35
MTDFDAAERDYLDEFGDIDTAIELVKGLNAELDEPADEEEAIRLLRRRFATDQAVRDVRTGCMTLLMLFGAMFDEPPLDFVPAAIRKLGKIREIPEDVLPMIAGGMTAAFLRMSPNQWRDALGPVSNVETMSWVYATWTLVNYIDHCKEEKGAAFRQLDETMRRVFDTIALEDHERF